MFSLYLLTLHQAFSIQLRFTKLGRFFFLLLHFELGMLLLLFCLIAYFPLTLILKSLLGNTDIFSDVFDLLI